MTPPPPNPPPRPTPLQSVDLTTLCDAHGPLRWAVIPSLRLPQILHLATAGNAGEHSRHAAWRTLEA